MTTKNQNPHCEDNRCRSSKGEVRTMPNGFGKIVRGKPMNVCYACFALEIRFRRTENLGIERDWQIPTPDWETLPIVYNPKLNAVRGRGE